MNEEIKKKVESILEKKISVRSMNQNGLPYFKVNGGCLTGEQIMGWHIVDQKGFTAAISSDSEFTRLVSIMPKMIRTLLDLLYHYHIGDELKDYCDEIYDRIEEIFESKKWDTIIECYKAIEAEKEIARWKRIQEGENS